MKSLGANVVAELLFSLCMYTVLRAFGQDVGYAEVVLVNEFARCSPDSCRSPAASA